MTTEKPSFPLDQKIITTLVHQALKEDIQGGDCTTNALCFPESVIGCLRTREKCVIAGLPLVEEGYRQLDRSLSLECSVKDGTSCSKNQLIAMIVGSGASMLTGERTILNFLQHLSGIASVTKEFVDILGASKTKLLDTRKTTPCLRHLEKYAVKMGGGFNHRMGLYDQVMIKDNHLLLADSPHGTSKIRGAIEACRKYNSTKIIEVEVETITELKEAIEAKADIILLDNMDPEIMCEAVHIRNSKNPEVLLEASGRMTLERVREIREIGLDYISVGVITHSAKAIDIGLDIFPE